MECQAPRCMLVGVGLGGAGRMASAQHGMELRGVMVHWSRVVFEGLDGAGWIPS